MNGRAPETDARPTARLVGLLSAFLLSCFISGCSTIRSITDFRVASTPVCVWNDATGTLSLSGPTSQFMVDCLQRHRASQVNAIEINSLGGDVEAGINAAEILAEFRTHVIVTGNCSSSCANYLLPVASRITLQPGARIVLHGSVDPLMVQRRFGSGYESGVARKQAEFVEKYNVPLGWLLYRTTEAHISQPWGIYVAGEPRTWGGSPQEIEFLLVEEEFITSCLKNVDLSPFINTDVQTALRNESARLRLTRGGIFPTGTMRCKADDPPVQ